MLDRVENHLRRADSVIAPFVGSNLEGLRDPIDSF